ncbi:Flavin-dependent oxidoreductase, luciferase family (includes alkanesulfonate monooxygenase SsuD and methylene tetrahydromethanopterin reductase) [Pseudonocardia ammonioxydans]|uniref:Flavin-dependent oxidoreductase, luciferase family (Includes alkanesulfonate monooxygenase SsuD and methylene tetrahydromethanopterin reductase) n=1 Tax=Pseudonocardia ammonioxydans TaxID=260086 RepID=A0A1I4XV53_PSUAM|nr:LLM class flavin-dependent oxidoreductase [Pseudonocardia ammonioxydans]SFN29771.1 Flavin-dependent oxidoreductase, luciferase family (includes alkanesulfonate monooxygenase SsuD and methylene tetrahydromethanopterin reductase) [Pseudonocardia ammonioxydans]
MQYWHFSETAYPYLPPEETINSIRVTLPNGVIDPDVAMRLWDRYLAEWQIADECGINVMINEHHSTATCMDPAAPIIAGTLGRLTTNARILILGNPVANRKDPVRVAEEMALVDLLSHGRLEVGFVRGVPYEVSAVNSKPVQMSERMWEAIELIQKAWTTHDGPFNWEGRFFQQRHVNIWPRPYQQPNPPVWVTAMSPGSAARVADNNYVIASFLTGYEGTRKVFQAYRDRMAETGRPAPADDRFAYAALTYTGETDEEGLEGARKLMWYVKANKVPFEFVQPPGYTPYFARAAGLRGERSAYDFKSLSLEDLIEEGIVFAGSPSTVRGQIEKFYEKVGGFGHLLLMGQAGFLEHDETVKGIRTFAEQVKPALDGLYSPQSVTV